MLTCIHRSLFSLPSCCKLNLSPWLAHWLPSWAFIIWQWGSQLRAALNLHDLCSFTAQSQVTKEPFLKRLGLLTRRAVILNIYAIIFFRIGLTILCFRENIITWKFQEGSRAVLKLKWNWFLTNYQVYPLIWFPFFFFFCMSVLLYLFFSVSSPSDYLLFFPLVIISKAK